MTNARQSIEYTVFHDTTRTDAQKLELIGHYVRDMAPKRTPSGFVVVRRDEGHWDICSDRQRDWRIRGEPGAVTVCDERKDADGNWLADRYQGWLRFPSVAAAMAFISDHYMQEN